MSFPTLDDLPAPPARKVGWPWTESGPPSRVEENGGRPVTRVSIVTPSYNQACFLEETIRSVLLQGYPNLEYIIVDGGSTDESVEIIRKYERWLAYWASESDSGQSDAINKGFKKATGGIVAWLNSDDVFMPGAVGEAAQYLCGHPKSMVVYGESNFVDAESKLTSHIRLRRFVPPDMFFEHFIPQPSAFIRASALRQVGPLDQSLQFCMDYDLWLRIALVGRIDCTPRLWSKFRVHASSKGSTLQTRRWEESASILLKVFAMPNVPSRWKRYYAQAVGRAHWMASVESFRENQPAKSKAHIQEALKHTSNFIATSFFAETLVGNMAGHTTDVTLEFVDEYFQLIPTLKIKKAAYCRARARAHALLALNEDTPSSLARGYARGALKLDPRWFSNRHVLSRAFR